MKAEILNDNSVTADELIDFVSDISKNERVLLDTKGNLVYSGTFTSILESENVRGVLIKLDQKTGLSIWCPLDHIQRIRRVFYRSQK